MKQGTLTDREIKAHDITRVDLFNLIPALQKAQPTTVSSLRCLRKESLQPPRWFRFKDWARWATRERNLGIAKCILHGAQPITAHPYIIVQEDADLALS